MTSFAGWLLDLVYRSPTWRWDWSYWPTRWVALRLMSVRDRDVDFGEPVGKEVW